MNNDIEALKGIIEKLVELEEKEPVLAPLSPSELHKKLSLKLDEDGLEDKDLYQILGDLLQMTPRTATKEFFNQLFGGRNSKAVVGDMLASFMNNSMYTFKVGGPQILIEKEVINNLIEMLGYGEGAGGTMAPGGSMTNFMGMLMARDRAIHSVHNDGVSQKMTMYVSECSHYSLAKNASFMGIGRSQVRFIEATPDGRMDISKLETRIQQDKDDGEIPFLVVATAGTTVIGAFDDINRCADICEENHLWLHVDGAYGGSVMFSEKQRHLIDGAHRADSFSVNAHKLLGVPLACSFVFAKNKQYLYETFSNEAEYLYQTDEDDLNPGMISLQCGRRNDALKFWILWKSIGRSGLEMIVDHEFELAQYARDYVSNNPNYTLYNNDKTVNICFNYKNIDPVRLCNLLYEKGELMVGYGKFHDQEFVRLVSVNSNNSREDMDHFFHKLEDFVEKNKSLFHNDTKI